MTRSTRARPSLRRGTFANSMTYVTCGSGSRVLLVIPGGPGNVLPNDSSLKRQMKPLLPLLDEDMTIWFVARKQNMPVGHTVEDMATDYAELIETEFAGRVEVVFGSSYGGMIAQYLAANHPSCFSHLVVHVAAHRVENAEDDLEFAQRVLDGRAGEGYAILMRSLYPKPPMRWLARPLGALAAWVVKKHGHDGYEHDLVVEAQAELAFDSRDALPRIDVPVLLITGSEDSYFPAELAAETARLISDCIHIVYKGKDHMGAAFDKRVTGDVRAFIGRDRT